MGELSGRHVLILALLGLLILIPVTLPVTVLRGLVLERFGVSEFLTSLFMSVNMVGAILGAPLAGAVSDRLGRRKPLMVGALVLDAVLLWSLTLPVPFPLFMGLRFVEGMAHIFALSLLLALASDLATLRRGRVLGATGAGISLGVAVGAPLGGILGSAEVGGP